MKVLFLDFDGVLNTHLEDGMGIKFNKAACINLEYLLNKVSDLKIVVSSDWRDNGLDNVKHVLKENGIDPRRVVDITGQELLNNKDYRGHQIHCWIKNHPEVKNFVIFDDRRDMKPYMDRLVRINPIIGLTESNIEKAIDLLTE